MNQIVGADGNKIHQFEQAADGERGGGDFNHAAERHFAIFFAALGQLALGGFEMHHALFQFGERGDHGPHHVDFALGGCAQNGAHLGAEHHRLGQAQADAGEAEGGVEAAVGGGVLAEPARVFVYAQIHGADGELLAFELFNQRAVNFVLLVFGGQGVAVEIKVFAAEQAHAVGAGAVQLFDVFGRFDVGQQFDVEAVFGGGGGFLEFVECAFAVFVFAHVASVFGQHGVVGVDNQHAVDAVYNHPFVFAD